MPKFKYRVELMNLPFQTQLSCNTQAKSMDELGKLGWELVAVTGIYMFYKRQETGGSS